MKKQLRLVLIGFGMGAADLVPGVSGGTIAFISGIYKELVESIKIVSGPALLSLLRGDVAEAFRLVPFAFLIPLGGGLIGAVLSLSSLLTFLLHAHAVSLRSFFFGLVLASVFVVRKQIRVWNGQVWAAFLFSVAAAYVLVGLVPVQTSASAWAFFVSGAIAICAMILPGISGSFLLLIMGKYEQVLMAVHERDFVTLGVFLLGVIVGLALFSRLLSWMFAHYYTMVMAVLTGLMLGSLRRLWPWHEAGGNYIPQADASLLVALLLLIAGVIIVWAVDHRQGSISTSSPPV